MSVTQNNHDRNLIFGIVALHLDFISQDQLIAAMQEWLLDKTRTLGDILLKQGVLSEARKSMLSMLVEEHLQQHGNDPVKSLNTFGNLAPLREELQSMGDPDIYRAASLMPGPQFDDAIALATMAHAPERKPKGETRFSIVRRLAEGGLGVVWVAIDSELVREVALKEIKPQFADHGNSRARFLQEAEITGRLEHPGIVPVYGLGKYLDGRPYYAMRMIKGESLQSAIEQHHETKGSATQRSLALRELLQRFVDVCNAIEYAHSRGILHRDLKPDNVMLGKYGETLVVDWGLAKAIGEGDLKTRSDETVIMPELGGDSVPTRMGEVVGTVAFMSPEQAAGKHRELTPASDIFSLGAILYNIITGVPAQKKGTMPELLRNVREAKFPRPRDVNQAAPPALEAICLKAMAQYPQDRYVSAQKLAADIERYLADEPVVVFREPALQRFRRWTRHHPKTVTFLAASSALLIMFASVMAVWRDQVAKERTEKSRQLEQQRADLADAYQKLDSTYTDLKKANQRTEDVQNFLVGVFKSPDPSKGAKDLKVVDVLEPKLQEVLTGAGERLSDPAGRAQLLDALGRSFLGLGIYDKAILAFEDALRIRQKTLGDNDPETLDSMNSLASAYQKAGMRTKAREMLETNYQKTREVRGEEHPDTVNALNNLNAYYFGEKLFEKMITSYQQALQKAQRNNSELDKLRVMVSLSACYAELRRFEDALPMAEQAYGGLRARLGPHHENTLTAMANLGFVLGGVGQFDKAIELLMECRQLCEKNYPVSHDLTSSVIKNLSRVYQQAGQYDTAIELLVDRARQLRGETPNLNPSAANFRELLRQLAECDLEAGFPANAEEVCRSWLEITSKLEEPDPLDEARARSYLALACLDQDKLEEARKEADAAESFFSSQQTAPAEQLRAQLILGLVLGKQGLEERAKPVLEKACQTAQQLTGSMTRDTFETIRFVGPRVVSSYEVSGNTAAANRWREVVRSCQQR